MSLQRPGPVPLRAERPHAALPLAPRANADTGLAPLFLQDLVLRAMSRLQLQHLLDLSRALRLPARVLDNVLNGLRKEALVEIRLRGTLDTDVSYALTLAGRERAAQALSRSAYCGPAPVPLGDYLQYVARQARDQARLGRESTERRLADMVLPTGVLERIGPGLGSRRAVLLHGAAGTGKSYLCQQLTRLLDGSVFVPHAVEVDGEVIRVFDPLVHRPVERSASSPDRLDVGADARWVECHRPVVITGGELTLEMLELGYDSAAGCYQAPPQFKANNGLFVIDDLGRQRVQAHELFNRWILPLESRHDWLTLRSGVKFQLPFEAALVFSTNAEPQALADEAFLRRIGYKIEVGALNPVQYARLLVRACDEQGVEWTPEGQNALFHRHDVTQRPLHACVPRDLVGQILDHAIYNAEPATLSPRLVDWVWSNYFGALDESRHSRAASVAALTNPPTVTP